MPTPDNTTISLPGQAITDARGNVWSLANGHVLLNGRTDRTTAGVIQLAYVDGMIWQETVDDSWRSKSSPFAPWSAPVAKPPLKNWVVSSDDTVISMPGQAIHDAAGNTWSIAFGQVALNGVMDGSTSHVIQIAYENGVIWMKNADNLWWSKSNPAASWYPSAGTSANPMKNLVVSQNNTVTYDAIHSITDAAGNNWSLIEGRIYLNGVADPSVGNVVMLAYENGQIWEENADGTWHAKTKPSDPWGPAVGNPVTVTGTKTWIANNTMNGQNFYDPENWGGGFGPKPGDTAVIQTGAPVIDAALGIQSAGADGLTLVLGTPVVGQNTTLTVKGNITFAQAMTVESPGADASGTVGVAGGTLTNNGHILANDTDNLGISLNNGSFINNGVLQESGAHGFLGVYGTGTIANNGSVLVNGGMLELDKQVIGTGSMEIDGGGMLKFGNAVGSGEVITINNGMLDFCAVLTTNPAMQFLGTIAFAGIPGAREQIQINSSWAGDANNSVTLTNIQPGLADLSVYENDVKVMQATLSGHYDASEFSLSHAAANVILTFTPHALTDAVPHS